jgi:tetratricopeptide (TPR) repeat protein
VSLFAIIALVGWVPIVIVLFALLPARRAMLAGTIGGWLLLPPAAMDLQGMPPYTKSTAATIGILLATVIFEPGRLLAFRPRWFDLPMLVLCLCPFCSSISNGLGPYDGFSMVFRAIVTWMLPYLVGRLYLTDLNGLRDLALGMIIGSLCLIPFCLLEMQVSAQLLPMVYGIGKWEGTRYGGFRPRVFLADSLELGLWMNAAALVALWLWRVGQLKRLGSLSAGAVATMLLVTSVLCRCTGATILLLLGVGSLWFCRRTGTKWLMWALLFAGPIYYAMRITHMWSGEQAVEVARSLVGDERAWSLQFRLWNEETFILKALQRPIFGWGGWGRIFIYDERGGKQTIADQLTDITFATNGFVGLVAFAAVLLLPPGLFLKRFPAERWIQADLAPTVPIAVILTLYLLDCTLNGMFNAIYIIAAGGVLNIAGDRRSLYTAHHVDGKTVQAADTWNRLPAAEATPEMSTDLMETHVEADAKLLEPQEVLTLQYETLGRNLKTQGRLGEAKAIWLHSLDLWTELSTTYPDHPLLHDHWCDCANNLAWLLANAPDLAVRDVPRAIALAHEAAQANPDCPTYWNTLGVAYYRAGDFDTTIAALERAIDLTGGGTAFDHAFLAMAHAQLGNHEQAQEWLNHARIWMEQHSPDHSELACLCDEARSVLAAASGSSVTV